MEKYLFISLTILLAKAAAQENCGPSLEEYFRCMHAEMEPKAVKLEREYYNSLRRKMKRCFGQDEKGKYCPMPSQIADVFEHETDCTSILGGNDITLCPLNLLRTLLQNSVETLNKTVRHCINENGEDTMSLEASECMKEKIGPNFNFGRQPDFDEFYYRDVKRASKSWNLHIFVKDAMQTCRPILKEGEEPDSNYILKLRQYKKTAACWNQDDKSGSYYRPNHCEIAEKCLEKSYACTPEEVKSVFHTFCTCAREKRVQMVGKGVRVGEDVLEKQVKLYEQGRTDAQKCGQAVMEYINSGNIDWREEMDISAKKCGGADNIPGLSAIKDFMSFDLMLEQGCQAAFEGKMDMANRGLSLVVNFVGAHWSKMSRFCTCS